jgi:redox-sensitive bicupin YhaK (pirin superfamily)
MAADRVVRRIVRSNPVVEGAGVHLQRVFTYHQAPELDPFLLLDDFHSSEPSQYLAGFPWHPHRGIETITYVLEGEVEHGDSMGNQGVIQAGGVQWMTAGSGIVHQEMPRGRADGLLWGFQLWANLPASHKMMDPRYQELAAEQVPEVAVDHGVRMRVVCGHANGVEGPVRDVVTDPQYLDVTVPAGARLAHAVQDGYTAFAYVVEGDGLFGVADAPAAAGSLVVFAPEGECLRVRADAGVRFLLVSGRPLREPVAWRGPIVMNTQEELRIAFDEYQRGTFLKHLGR